jgi:hypothetical protein
MAIDWSHLPQSVLNNVCMGGHNGCLPYDFRIATDTPTFFHDDKTGWMKCSGCKKPKLDNRSVQQCDLCDKVFVPKMYDKVLNDFLGIACDECEPPK